VNCVGGWHSERPRCPIGMGSRKKYQYRISRNAAHGGAGCPHRHGEIKHTGRCRSH
jgi:radical SAM superfamily enzyme